MFALKALRSSASGINQKGIQGIVELLHLCQENNFSRYYGIDNYAAMPVDTLAVIPEFSSVGDALCFAFGENKQVYANQSINGRYHFFMGEKLHGMTHAHAVYELEKMGYTDIAKKSLAVLRKQFFLNRQRPPAQVNPLAITNYISPDATEFWQRPKADTHNLKLAYAALSSRESLAGALASDVWPDLSVYWNALD